MTRRIPFYCGCCLGLIAIRQHHFLICLWVSVLFAFPDFSFGQNSNGSPANQPSYLPRPVSAKSFANLTLNSPFRRSLNNSKGLILTGISKIDNDIVATVHDLETRQSFTVSNRESNREGWQLVDVKGDQSDLETLTARIKISGAEIVAIRYDKAPPPQNRGRKSVMVSGRIGNGTAGGGTDPHGGPDPRVLTRDQLSDARDGARNYKNGFKADGYADGTPVPAATLSKVAKLSVQQRENINVKMYEYRNKGLGMQERQKIYNNMLDQELRK